MLCLLFDEDIFFLCFLSPSFIRNQTHMNQWKKGEDEDNENGITKDSTCQSPENINEEEEKKSTLSKCLF